MKETAVNNFILKNVQRPVYKAKMLSIGNPILFKMCIYITSWRTQKEEF